MHRFFVSRDSIVNDHVNIAGDDAEQIKKVLRIREGEEIVVLDGYGWEYYIQLTEIKKGNVNGKVKFKDFKSEDTKINIAIGQGIPKGEKMDFVIQKATELGISEITPLKLERCIVKVKDEGSKKVVRWQRIAKESAEQSMRRFIPLIHTVSGLKEFCDRHKEADLKMVLWESKREKALRDLLESRKKVRTISIIIGPEGGLIEKEIEIAGSSGFIPVWLGSRILRTDTAALTVLSILQYLYGDVGQGS